MAKTTDYLLQKGFESELVQQAVNRLKEEKNEEE
jgi:SOS response regulatory protein OraA/RecX